MDVRSPSIESAQDGVKSALDILTHLIDTHWPNPASFLFFKKDNRADIKKLISDVKTDIDIRDILSQIFTQHYSKQHTWPLQLLYGYVAQTRIPRLQQYFKDRVIDKLDALLKSADKVNVATYLATIYKFLSLDTRKNMLDTHVLKLHTNIENPSGSLIARSGSDRSKDYAVIWCFGIAAITTSELISANYMAIATIVEKYIVLHHNKFQSIICQFLINHADRILVLDKRRIMEELTSTCQGYDNKQLVWIDLCWDDLLLEQQICFHEYILKLLGKKINCNLHLIWRRLSSQQQLIILEALGQGLHARTNDDVAENQQASIYSKDVLTGLLSRCDLTSLSEICKNKIKDLIRENESQLNLSNQWLMVAANCVALFPSGELTDYSTIFSNVISKELYLDDDRISIAVAGLVNVCTMLPKELRRKYIDEIDAAIILYSAHENSLVIVEALVSALCRLLSCKLDQDEYDYIFSAIISRMPASLRGFCFYISSAETLPYSQEALFNLTRLLVDKIFMQNISGEYVGNAIASLMNKLHYTSDRKVVISDIISYGITKDKYVPCLLAKLEDHLPHSLHGELIQVLTAQYLDDTSSATTGWDDQVNCRVALQQMAKWMNTQQIATLLIGKFMLSEPIKANHHVHELYLYLSDLLMAKMILVSDELSFFQYLQGDMKGVVTDYVVDPSRVCFIR